MTILVGGLILGGWALILGLIAIVVTGLGWLWDARREYVAVEEADITGHLDAGGNPSWPKATFAALAAIVVRRAGPVVQPPPELGGGEAVASGGAAGAGAGLRGPAPERAARDRRRCRAHGEGRPTGSRRRSPLPAGKPFTLAMDNQDALPHDVQLKDAGGAEVFRGAVVTGPAVAVYDVPALPAGQYTYICTIHTNMTGTATAQ